MAADRPINADVPEPDEPEKAAPKGPPERDKGAASGGGKSGKGAPSGGEPPMEGVASGGGESGKGVASGGGKPGKGAAAGPPGPQAPASAKPEPAPPPPLPRTKRRRPRIPGALVFIGGLVVVAIGFIALAVVAGSGGGPDDDSTAPSPAPAPLVAGGEAPSDEGDGGDEEPAAESSEGLGYPAFATANTTRVGGATAAENAAAVALAVFPSSVPAERPAAVALVAEDEWPAAIAAAVLMAPPVRVPLLFSGPDETPVASEEALAVLDPQGSEETSGARGFAFGAALVPDSLTGVETIRGGAAGEKGPAGAADADSAAGEGGEEPAATAAAIADLRDRLFDSPPKAIVLAPLGAPGFAAPAAAWAARSGDPVLFTATEALPKATEAALKKHTKAPVYVLGPSEAIADAVLAEVKKLGNSVQRVAGADPVKNALAFARYSGDGFGWNVNDPGHGFVLAAEGAPLDAAAAAPLSAAGTWGPLLLTDSAGTLPPEVRDYLLDVKPGYTTNPTRAYYNHVWVIGDQEAIDVKQQAEANELAALAKIGAE